MKKLNLFFVIALIAGLGFFTGCEEEAAVGPSISFFGGEYIDEDATVEPGAALDFKVSLTKGDAGLDEFVVVSQNEDVFGPMTGTDLDNADQEYTINLTAPLDEDDHEFLFKLTDKDNLTDTKSIVITVESATTPLGTVESTTWERVGGNDGTGLDMFGLKWTSNTSTHANITKDGADKFVELPSNAWEEITTVEGLVIAIDNSTDMDTYTGIDVQADKSDYDDILGVKYGDGYFMIKIDESDVSTGTAGTTITVSIKYVEG